MGKHGMDFEPWRFGRLADSRTRLVDSTRRLMDSPTRLTYVFNNSPLLALAHCVPSYFLQEGLGMLCLFCGWGHHAWITLTHGMNTLPLHATLVKGV